MRNHYKIGSFWSRLFKVALAIAAIVFPEAVAAATALYKGYQNLIHADGSDGGAQGDPGSEGGGSGTSYRGMMSRTGEVNISDLPTDDDELMYYALTQTLTPEQLQVVLKKSAVELNVPEAEVINAHNDVAPPDKSIDPVKPLAEKKSFPWKPVLAVGGVLLFLFRSSGKKRK